MLGEKRENIWEKLEADSEGCAKRKSAEKRERESSEKKDSGWWVVLVEQEGKSS
jgi:hypothetical protein